MKRVSRRTAMKMAAGALALAALGPGVDAPLGREEPTQETVRRDFTIHMVMVIEVDEETGEWKIRDA